VSEGTLWARLRRELGPHGRLVRVENRCDRGTPDVHYALRRVPGGPVGTGWLELKHEERWPPRAATLCLRTLTLEQVTWHEEETRAGGATWLFAQIGRDGLLLQGALSRLVLERRFATEQARALAWPLTELRPRLLRALVP
jgi:hypothetical protein